MRLFCHCAARRLGPIWDWITRPLLDRRRPHGTIVHSLHGQPGTVEITRYYTFASLSAGFGGAYEATGSTWKKYYSFGGQMVAMRTWNPELGTSELSYFLSTHLGSTSVVLDDEGTILEQQRYLPFGQTRELPNYATIQLTDFTYTGQRNLPDTGLMDYDARFYAPMLGRFIQPYTITPDESNPQAWNRYSYTFNNPLVYTDPSGHAPSFVDPWPVIFVIMTVVAFVAILINLPHTGPVQKQVPQGNH